MTRALTLIPTLPERLAVLMIRVYQVVLSPMVALTGARCRYHPTCSSYAILAIRKHGLLHGGLKTASRLLRCAPWGAGGEDLP